MKIEEFFSKFDIPVSEAVEFMVTNNWFDMKPSKKNGQILLTPEQTALFAEKLETYLSTNTYKDVFAIFKNMFPLTAKDLIKFFRDAKVPPEAQGYLSDFLITYMTKDIALHSNAEIEDLLNIASTELIRSHAELLTFFLSYVRTKRKTKYFKAYGMAHRKMDNNGAYTFDEYIQILYYLFNEGYIEANGMYQKAAHSKNYADTWLFLSMHFICSLRMTDLERIYHPRLPRDPEVVLEEIEIGTFSDNDAREVLLSITRRLCMLPLTPNKTKDTSHVPDIKFEIPYSCEVHIGKLFALAEAHQQVSGKKGPMIRRIASFEQITRYMGEDIGLLFLENNFRCRKANKSFMQSIENLSQDVLGEEGPKVKGHILAALARSHKASYGQFASTAANYLRDQAFSGMTPEFVAFELFERGVLSCIPSMLLNILTGGEYKQLEPTTQTKLVKKLGLSPNDVEGIMSIVNQSQKRAQKALTQAVTDEMPILEILHNIGSGAAFSKQPECLCLLSAVHKSCPYEQRQCIGCDYEIGTMSTLYLIASEYNRMVELYQIVDNPLEKKKYETLVRATIIPKLEELLQEIRHSYGEKVCREYEEMVKRYVERNVC